MDNDEMQRIVVPVMGEELITGTREVVKGSVRIRKEVEQTMHDVHLQTLEDVVEVTRVEINRAVDSVPEIREEGDVLVVPVLEEQMVVEKRLILRAELRIRRSRVERTSTQPVTLSRERVTVERLDADGVVVETLDPGESGGAVV